MAARDPITLIRNDRTEARKLADANADTCFLALADSDGNASVRTLILREINGHTFLLFVNQSSPKWKILTSGSGGSYQLLLWYPTMQRQYRISGTTGFLATEIVKQNWQRRPRGSKYLDILYEHTADQSTPMASREALVKEINRIRAAYKVDDMEAPDKVAGIQLIADQIEMLDLNREDRIHDRQLFTRKGEDWTSQVLVP